MRSDGFDPRVLRFLARTGYVFAFMWPFAAIVIAHHQYIPPPSATDTAAQVVKQYLAHTTGLRIASIVFIFASIFYTTWSMSIVQMVRARERRWPVLFNLMVVAVACEAVVVMLIGFFFGAAAWRPGETSAAVTQAFNDLGWLGILFTGAPFALFQIALAATTLLDQKPVFPRWSAYFNLFTSVFMVEASLILMFKTGPMSQDGIMVFWLPMVIFFSWIVIFSALTLRAIRNEEQAGAEVTSVVEEAELVGI